MLYDPTLHLEATLMDLLHSLRTKATWICRTRNRKTSLNSCKLGRWRSTTWKGRNGKKRKLTLTKCRIGLHNKRMMKGLRLNLLVLLDTYAQGLGCYCQIQLTVHTPSKKKTSANDTHVSIVMHVWDFLIQSIHKAERPIFCRIYSYALALHRLTHDFNYSYLLL